VRGRARERVRSLGSAEGAASELRALPVLIAGRYRIEAALGRGGAAQVLRVTDVSRDAQLALKRLAWNAKPRLVAQFELEYQTLASLKHPRIVEVFEYGRDPEGAFYTMELLAGEDLRDRAPIPWRETCRYLRDAAEALGLLHARRLVHRDVSPRNLWRSTSGRVKLIDFGALSPFGPVDHLMGTSPFIPPEAFYGQDLDQRADLYGLGALAYYLLTGLHAYPAHDPRELPELWKLQPVPPSHAVAELARDDLDAIPAELDALVAALLSQNVLARPGSSAEVIDRLDVLLGVTPGGQNELAEIHLSNGAFVGRARESRRLRRMLRLASKGRGQSCVIESEPGLGRSRMLRELELWARVTDVTVVHVDAAGCSGVYGVASALGLKLLDALPEPARAAAAPHAALLAHVSPALRERLAATPMRVRDADLELSVRVQGALRDWLLAVAESHPLVVLVDGLELADAGSAACLLGLALELKRKRLLLASTLVSTRNRVGTPAERELCKASHRVPLPPLESDAILELLRSVFGSAEHLGRLALRLQQTVRGNPGHMLELCEQLVRQNVIGFTAGTWVLPHELPDSHLTSSREGALLRRLSLLNESARELGRVLSVHPGVISLDLCRALAKSVSADLFVQLGALLDLEILVQGLEGVRFSHEHFRVTLRAELDPERRRRVRRVLGEYLLSLPELSTLERLRAGVHLLDGGDARGADVAAQASLYLTMSEGGKISSALADLEEALALFRAQGRPNQELLALLAPLSLAGFQTHRRYGVQYGDLAVSALEEVLGLALAKKLSPRVGGKLALVAGLGFAAVRFRGWRKNARVPSYRQAIYLLFNCVATLTASSAQCLDFVAARRYAEVLAPFSAFGSRHIAGFMHEYCRALADAASDRPGTTYERWQQILARLESSERIRGVSKKLRARYRDGALVASGALEAQRDGQRALASAERLDSSGFYVYKLSAEQTRGLYYAHQGNFRLFERYRQRAEHHAVQQGTSWQVETWASCALTAVYMRMHDAMGMKQAAEQLQRLTQEIPALEPHARRARGTYLLMREKYAEALPWLEECLREEPRVVAGWGRMHGVLARAQNRMGNHEAARGTCLRALGQMDPEDLEYAAFSLIIGTELLIAEAGLGKVEDARRGLAKMIERHGERQGPLTMGELHEAGLEIALLVGDDTGARQHFEQMERWYLSTGSPSLAQRCEALSKKVHAPDWSAARARGDVTSSEFSTQGSLSLNRRMHTVDRMLAGGSMSLADRAQKALQILVDRCGTPQGHLYLFDVSNSLRLFASLDAEPIDPEVERRLRERVVADPDDDVTQLIEVGGGDAEHELFEHAGRYYRVLVLTAARGEGQKVVGAALLAASDGYPGACPFEISRSVGHHLRRALTQGDSTSLG
jgi:tetratricopeptide (TPR) repeat protein